MSRLARLILACLVSALAAGGLATLYVSVRRGAPPQQLPSAGLLASTGAVAVLMLVGLFIRFVRWQFVLRRLDQRIPAVESLAAFIGSFAFLPIPLLLGQLAARRRLLPETLRTSAPANVLGFVWERLLDAWALAWLATLLLPSKLGWLALGVALAGLVPPLRRKVLELVLGLIAGVWNLLVPQRLEFDSEEIERVSRGGVFVAGTLASLAAWAITASGLALLASNAGVSASLWNLSGAAAASVLIGGLSLLPMGVAVSGLVLLEHFEAIGASQETALEIVFAYRAATVWFSFVLGWAALGLGYRHTRRLERDPDHFDAIDDSYDAWLPPHYRDHMVNQKVGRMTPHLDAMTGAPLGLDIGCGRGWYLDGVRGAQARVMGIDLSRAQLAAARAYAGAETPLAQASITDLPFQPRSFDFAYTINVVHHLPSREHQRSAFAEVARVLRPGGLLFLHEMNIRNPLFRGYLGYVFPILKGIDEGIEHFLDPRDMPLPPDLELVSVEYFTFVPDLCPAPLLPLVSAIERRLEKSPLAPLGVHFLAVLRRRDDGES